MQLEKLVKVASILVGVLLAIFGFGVLAVAAVGDFSQGRFEAVAIGSGLLLLAFASLAYLFSVRLAKSLLVLFLFELAATVLWLVFRPEPPVARPAIHQAAAIAFAVLLLARVGLAMRRGRSKVSG